jgi:hypothetical protein
VVPDSPVARERLHRWNSNLKEQNLGIVTRVLEPKIRETVLGKARKLVLQSKEIPTGLMEQEQMFNKKVLSGRSKYSYLGEGGLLENIAMMEGKKSHEIWDLTILEAFQHPYRESTEHVERPELPRNRSSEKRNGGLPTLQKRREMAAASRQYNELIKSSGQLEDCWSMLVGYRTQQPGEGAQWKVRAIYMWPDHMNRLEREAADSAITNTQEANDMRNPIIVFYCEPSELKTWYGQFSSSVVCWVNLDATKFDISMTGEELESSCLKFYPNYELVGLLISYHQTASVVYPDGVIESRWGSIGSGSKTTNLFDGYANVMDILDSINKAGLLKYVVCILVNGDDITVGFSTWITESNLSKIAKFSRRTINVSKSVVGDYVWNSKWFIGENRSGEILMSRPIMRVLNSIMYAERRKESIYGSKEYVEVALTQQLQDIEGHPHGEQVAKWIKDIDKYHISEFSDSQLSDAAEAYLDDHRWQTDQTIGQFLGQLKDSMYAKL